MRSDWPEVRLGDHVDLLSGFPFSSGDYCDSTAGVRLLRGDNIVQRGLRWAGAKYWPADRTAEVDSYRLHRGDVVVAMDRPWIEAGLKVARIGDADTPCLLVQRVSRIRGSETLAQEFLAYVLYSQGFTDYVLSVQTGTAVPHISGGQIRDFCFRLPPLAEQRRIAGVLGDLDYLIETNQRLADSCAGLRRALVRRALAECDETVPLSSVARFVNGKNFTKGASGRGLPVIRTPEIRRGPDASTVRSDVAAEQDFRASAGDILFVWSGSLMVERWLYEEGLVNQHIFKVIPEPGCPYWLVFALIEHQMPWFLGLAADKATTMGHIQRGHLDALVPWPGDEVLREVAQTVEPLWDQELALRIEMQQLAHTRDELLPLLLSGRVSVREVAA